jgi:hypothetical protein
MFDVFTKYLQREIRERPCYVLAPGVIDQLMDDLGFEEIKPSVYRFDGVEVIIPPGEKNNLYFVFARITHGAYQSGLIRGAAKYGGSAKKR